MPGPGNPSKGGEAGVGEYKPRKRRTEAEIIAGVDPFDYLCALFGKYNDAGNVPKAKELALELMPYCKPKLKSIDHKMSGAVHVSVRIGGEDDTPPLALLPSGGDTEPDEGGV